MTLSVKKEGLQPVLAWVEKYLKNLPHNGGYRYKPEGGAIDLLDLYGTEGTKTVKNTTLALLKTPQRRSEAAIQATLTICRARYKW